MNDPSRHIGPRQRARREAAAAQLRQLTADPPPSGPDDYFFEHDESAYRTFAESLRRGLTRRGIPANGRPLLEFLVMSWRAMRLLPFTREPDPEKRLLMLRHHSAELKDFEKYQKELFRRLA